MSADFTPVYNDPAGLKPFRFWCQKVLPLVYDDTLSYYELLCKVVDYLNHTMEDVNTLSGDVEGLHAAYVQLQDYVNEYFDNLDVQAEINAKLDSMAASGALSTLLAPYIPDLVSAWLEANITPTSPAVDASLTVSGAAADAKVTGEKIRDFYNSAMFKQSVLGLWEYGNKSVGGSDDTGYTLGDSAQTFSLKNIYYTDRPIVVFKKASAVTNNIECAVQIFTKSGNKYYGNLSLLSWFGSAASATLISTTIPSDTYFWIGFRNGSNPTNLTLDDINANFEVFTISNNIGLMKSAENRPLSYSNNSSIGNPDIKQALSDLYITSTDWSKARYTLQTYTGLDGQVLSTEYTLSKDYTIRRGTYYRLIRWLVENNEIVQFDSYEDAVNTIDSYFIVRNTNDVYTPMSAYANSTMYKKDVLHSFPFGNTITAGNETNGYRLDYSAQTFGTSNFIYAKNPVILHMKESAVTNGITVGCQAYKLESGKYVKQKAMCWFTANAVTSVSIPAGWYYWIGFRDGNNPTFLTLADVEKDFDVYEIADNFGYGASRATQMGISGAPNNAFVNINPIYADTDLLITCGPHWGKDIAITYEELASSESGGTNISYTKTDDFVVSKGTLFRIVVIMRENGVNVSGNTDYSTIKKYQDYVKIVPLDFDRNAWYQNDMVDAHGIYNYIGLLAMRVAALENVQVPSYYESHITQKIATIRAARVTDQFIFITDVHINGYTGGGGNAKHSHALINQICKDTLVNKIFNGGDFINSGTDTTPEEGMYQIKQAVAYTNADSNALHFVIAGNHDGGVDYLPDVAKYMTAEQVANASNVYGQSYSVVYDRNSPFEYYYDDEETKIRYIVLDLGLRDLLTGESYGNTLRFLLDSLLSLRKGWTAVIFNHLCGYDEETESFNDTYINYLLSVCDAYKAKGTYDSVSGYETNFANAAGTIACIVFGHKHADYQGATTGGIPWFITTTDNGAANVDPEATRTAGTTAEQAFDVFSIDTTQKEITVTRIGYGDDRTANY